MDHSSGNYINERLTAVTANSPGGGGSHPKPKLLPMSPLAASATIINLILATGPFR
jgi:hypothetical protein